MNSLLRGGGGGEEGEGVRVILIYVIHVWIKWNQTASSVSGVM